MEQHDEKLIYKIHNSVKGTIAIIHFNSNQFEKIPPIRSTLFDVVKKVTELPYRIDTGLYEDIDVVIRFFDSRDADVVNAFYSKSWPGCFSSLFRTRYYKEHKLEEEKVKKLIHIEISTSHDGPWFLVIKSPFAEEEITRCIEKVGDDLKVDFVIDTTTPSISESLIIKHYTD